MNFSFIKQLIGAAEQFAEQYPGNTDMARFARWLQEQINEQPMPVAPPVDPASGETLDSVLVKLLIYLNRYAKMYSKKALEGTLLGSVDEFVFLIYLENMGQATKMELIEMARLEKPTGMEIVRRLLKMGFITQEKHATDQRSKSIRITPQGQAALFSSFEKMGQVSHLVAGNLRLPEKMHLLQLLQQLEDFHRPIRQEFKNAGWEDIVSYQLSVN
jgi:MarR family transcriptional regulator, lower aerobic nicotinate degradation pathway regulator